MSIERRSDICAPDDCEAVADAMEQHDISRDDCESAINEVFGRPIGVYCLNAGARALRQISAPEEGKPQTPAIRCPIACQISDEPIPSISKFLDRSYSQLTTT